MTKYQPPLAGAATLVLGMSLLQAGDHTTPTAPMLQGLAPWTTEAIFTVGESVDGYTPPGILDGMEAFDAGDSVVLLVNHELTSTSGYPYSLANGTSLRGARISAFAISKETRRICGAGLAYDTIYNRAGKVVDHPSDLDFGGLNRFCSGAGYEAGTGGLVDAIYFAGEETSGGSEFALDFERGDLWAVPAMGRGAWENLTLLEVPSINRTHVAILWGDDRSSAPLYLFVGEKDRSPGAGFLARNGLATGRLYMWVADDGSTVTSAFLGSGNSKTGRFVEVENYQAGGGANFDSLGYATQAHLDAQRSAIGAFQFSRPEDLHTNPFNGTQVVFASTGSSVDNGSDSWGTTYLVDVQISPAAITNGTIGARIRVIYDGDENPIPGDGLRSPDNLTWAGNHFAYIQEDRSVNGFGGPNNEEASIWKVHPHSGVATRVAQMDRTVTLPGGQSDPNPADLGNWESSGIIDVTELFGAKTERLFLLNVQAHNVRNGTIANAIIANNNRNDNLVEGGQILFLSEPARSGKAKGSKK